MKSKRTIIVEKVDNGYLIVDGSLSGGTRICKDFATVVEELAAVMGEKGVGENWVKNQEEL